MEYITKTSQETEELGQRLAAELKGCTPPVLLLRGEMGAGKTVFVRGLARGLGYDGAVTSPTYSIVNEYLDENNSVKLLHFDLYRLTLPEQLVDIGWWDYLDRNLPAAIEWPELAENLVPKGCMTVSVIWQSDESRLWRVER